MTEETRFHFTSRKLTWKTVYLQRNRAVLHDRNGMDGLAMFSILPHPRNDMTVQITSGEIVVTFHPLCLFFPGVMWFLQNLKGSKLRENAAGWWWDCIAWLLYKIHWLPICWQTQFKVLFLAFLGGLVILGTVASLMSPLKNIALFWDPSLSPFPGGWLGTLEWQ